MATPLCALLGIQVPVIQGPLGGPWEQSMELAAAVCEAGALGSIPTSLRDAERVRRDMTRLRELTDRPFAVNHTRRPFDEEAFADLILPAPSPGGYPTVPRSLRTPFVDRWNSHRSEAERAAEELRREVGTAIQAGRAHELVPLTGQTAGMITEILPAAEIVRGIVAEAREALRAAAPLLGDA